MLIAQITDTHIVEKGKHWLSEPSTNTSERLEQAISFINQLNPSPDLVILTGDATDSGTPAAYDHLKELLQPLKPPIYLIPGNHDHREEMRRAFIHKGYMPSEGFINYVINDHPLRLICLDTHIHGKDSGHVCEQRFAWLKQVMLSGIEKPSVIFMHHHPVNTGYKLFDTIKCSVPADFEQFISSHANLLAIFTGHYHHLCVISYGKKTCYIAPSVAPVHYFAHPEDDRVTALELEDPAVTLHTWNGNNLISHVVRIKKEKLRIDWSTLKC